MSRLQETVDNTNRLINDYQFGDAQREVHDFFWNEYCDWYLELVKLRFADEQQPSPIPILVHVLESCLRLLHPFMPFVTEEIWQILLSKVSTNPEPTKTIMLAHYPVRSESYVDTSSGSGIVALVTTGVITSLRIGDSVNLEDEFNRLQSENSDISTYIKSLEKRLSNEGFISNAPEEVVQKEKTRLIGALERKSRLEDIIARLKS